MPKLCKAEREYCINKLEEVSDYIPFHYVEALQSKARERGMEVTRQKAHGVRNYKQFDKAIVDLFVELAEENKKQFMRF